MKTLQSTTKYILSIFTFVVLSACNTANQEAALTMVVQTFEARGTVAAATQIGATEIAQDKIAKATDIAHTEIVEATAIALTEAAKATATPIRNPTATLIADVQLPAPLLEKFPQALIVEYDNFDSFNTKYWEDFVIAYFYEEEGVLKIDGVDFWAAAIYQKGIKHNNWGVLFEIEFSKKTQANIFFDRGRWDSAGYARWGMNIWEYRFETNIYEGSNSILEQEIGNFQVLPDTPYYVHIGITQNDEGIIMIWPKDDPGSVATFFTDQMSEAWQNKSWKLRIQANQGQLRFYEYYGFILEPDSDVTNTPEPTISVTNTPATTTNAIQGRVYWASTGDPVEGVLLGLGGAEENSDADGHYVFADLAPGAYSFTLRWEFDFDGGDTPCVELDAATMITGNWFTNFVALNAGGNMVVAIQNDGVEVKAGESTTFDIVFTCGG